MNLKRFLTVLIINLACLSSGISAQVTIGSGNKPEDGALLDLKEREASVTNNSSVTDDDNITSTTGGLLLPRVKLQNKTSLAPIITGTPDKSVRLKHAGLTVYNLSTTADFDAGIYVWDGDKWTKVGEDKASAAPSFFYLPSFNLPLAATSQTYDLYENVYKAQFQKQGNSSWQSSDGTTTIGGTLYTRDQLEFVVIYFDPDVFSLISMGTGTNAGILTYTAANPVPTQNAPFMNIIVVVKP